MKYYLQRDDQWKLKRLGFGSGTIGSYGCYLTALASGLTRFGWDFDPGTLNDYLKSKDLYTGEFRNYIDVENIAAVLPDMFLGFEKIEPWDDMSQLENFLDGNYVVVAKVSAVGIGGTGTHFVLVDDTSGPNAIIHDPWTGEYQPVATRYGSLGNILGLRVFNIKPYEEGSMPSGDGTDEYKGLDLNNKDSMKVAVDTWADVRDGKYIKKTDADKAQEVAVKAAMEKGDTAIKNFELELKQRLDLTTDASRDAIYNQIDTIMKYEDAEQKLEDYEKEVQRERVEIAKAINKDVDSADVNKDLILREIEKVTVESEKVPKLIEDLRICQENNGVKPEAGLAKFISKPFMAWVVAVVIIIVGLVTGQVDWSLATGLVTGSASVYGVVAALVKRKELGLQGGESNDE